MATIIVSFTLFFRFGRMAGSMAEGWYVGPLFGGLEHTLGGTPCLAARVTPVVARQIRDCRRGCRH